MNKLTAAVLICSVSAVLIFSACTYANNNQNSSQNSAYSSASSQAQFTTQNITSISNLKMPDKIIYYHNGNQNIFTKDNPEFQNIIKLNTQRGQGKLEMIESVMTLDGISQSDKKLNMLIYKYDKTGYASIYFPLNAAADGQYIVAQPVTSTSPRAQNYGFLSSPDKLIDYIK